MAGESAIYKKFRAEQDAADAAYKKWEQEQWDKNGAEWTKQGYTRTADPNSAWGSTWKKNPVAGGEQAPVVKPEEKVEQKEPEVKVVPPVVEEAPKFSSYDDIMKQSWARRSHYGANNVWVDENGQKIADHKTHQGKKYQTFVTTGLFGDHNDLTYAYDPETGNIRRLHENWLGNIGDGWSSKGATGVVNNGDWGSLSDMLAQYGITYKKQGGTMNKVKYFQQGGVADIKEQIRPIVKAAMSPDKNQAEQAFAQIQQLVQKNPNLKPVVEAVIKEEQAQAQAQATSAKWGSKLQYIKSLKFAKGGKTCPACMSDGGSAPEKLQNKKQKMHVNPSDTVHVKGQPKSLTNSDGSRVDKRFPAYTAKDYQNDKKTKDGQKRRMKADLVSSEKCGGTTPKAKKHYFGGWL